MTTIPSPAPEVCARLKDRLQEAEAQVRDALRHTDADHPLAGAATTLLEIHREIRDVLLDSFEENEAAAEKDPHLDQAAVQIGREQHTAKADFMDMVKAFFMWRDDPHDRVRAQEPPR